MTTLISYATSVSKTSMNFSAGLAGLAQLSQDLLDDLGRATSDAPFSLPYQSLRNVLSLSSDNKQGSFQCWNLASLNHGNDWFNCCGVGLADSSIICNGGALTGTTTINLVTAIDQDFDAGTPFFFPDDNVIATLALNCTAGDTSLTVNALSNDIADGSVSTTNGQTKEVLLNSQTVTCDGGANASDNVLPVLPLEGEIEAGTLLFFNDNNVVVLVRSIAIIGATSVLVQPLEGAIADTHTATINTDLPRGLWVRWRFIHQGSDISQPTARTSFTQI